MSRAQPTAALLVVALAAGVAGCGGSGGPARSTPAPSGRVSSSAASTASTAPSSAPARPGALQAEANAAAAGDIPDNQIFLTFHDRSAGFSMRYPEGWAQRGSGSGVTFNDRSNVVRVVVATGPAPTMRSVRADVAALRGATVRGAPRPMVLPGGAAFRVSYATQSAPSQVTGRRVRLLVDRYYLWRAGRTAVVELGTPAGVDNVDAYRMMIESFRWS